MRRPSWLLHGGTGVELCSDIDELPAYSADEKWASLFEVIAPYKLLCRVPLPEAYTTRAPWPACLWEIPLANVPKAALWGTGQIKSTQSWIKVGGAGELGCHMGPPSQVRGRGELDEVSRVGLIESQVGATGRTREGILQAEETGGALKLQDALQDRREGLRAAGPRCPHKCELGY